MHYNSIMICINWMPQFTGEKVPYELNDLDSDNVMQIFVDLTDKYLWKFPPEEKITKKTMAAFIQTLGSRLVETKESPFDFAEMEDAQ